MLTDFGQFDLYVIIRHKKNMQIINPLLIVLCARVIIVIVRLLILHIFLRAITAYKTNCPKSMNTRYIALYKAQHNKHVLADLKFWLQHRWNNKNNIIKQFIEINNNNKISFKKSFTNNFCDCITLKLLNIFIQVFLLVQQLL